MGWKSALAGIAQIGTGAALMATGVGGPLGATLIAGGASTVAGGIGSDAAKSAAATQTKAGEQAIGEIRNVYGDVTGKQSQLYNQARTDNSKLYGDAAAQQQAAYMNGAAGLAPYMALGAGGAGNLGALVGLPALDTAAYMPKLPQMSGQGSLPSDGAGSGTGTKIDVTPMPTDAQAAGPGGGGQGAETPQVQAALSTQSTYQPSDTLGGLTGKMVKVASPNDPNDVMTVPENIARIWVARGAQIVG